MSDAQPTQTVDRIEVPAPEAPVLGRQIVTLVARHFGSLAAGIVLAHGWLSKGQGDAFAEIVTSAVILAVSVVASYLSKVAANRRWVAALFEQPPGLSLHVADPTPPTGGSAVQPPPPVRVQITLAAPGSRRPPQSTGNE